MMGLKFQNTTFKISASFFQASICWNYHGDMEDILWNMQMFLLCLFVLLYKFLADPFDLMPDTRQSYFAGAGSIILML